MAASAAFILDHKGKVLICRNYRGDVPMNVASKFVTDLLLEEELDVKPIVEVDGVSFIYVKHNSLYSEYNVPTKTSLSFTCFFLQSLLLLSAMQIQQWCWFTCTDLLR